MKLHEMLNEADAEASEWSGRLAREGYLPGQGLYAHSGSSLEAKRSAVELLRKKAQESGEKGVIAVWLSQREHLGWELPSDVAFDFITRNYRILNKQR